MIPENKVLIACTRKNFDNQQQKIVEQICSQNPINWETVYLTAVQHKVAPLVYKNLVQCDSLVLKIPLEILKIFEFNCQYWIAQKILIAKDIATIITYFQKKSVKVMLLKGVALDLLIYQDINGYVSGDVDLILKNRREDVTDLEDAEDVNFFKSFRGNQDGKYIEWERFHHHDVTINSIVPIDFQEVWHKANSIKFQDYDVWVMSPEFLLLTACLSSARKRFFRLKSLCDITEIINHYQEEIDWDKFIYYAKEYKCQNIVCTSLLITKITLESQIPEEVINNLTNNSIKAIVIRYVGQSLTESVPLASLLSSSGINFWGRKISVSSILPLITYDWHQLKQKASFLFNRSNLKIESEIK